MRFALFITVFLTFFFLSFGHAYAFIIIPALVVVSVAKIVAVIIAGLSLPAIGISALVAKLKGLPLQKGILIGLGILLLVGAILMVVLKIVIPNSVFF